MSVFSIRLDVDHRQNQNHNFRSANNIASSCNVGLHRDKYVRKWNYNFYIYLGNYNHFNVVNNYRSVKFHSLRTDRI